MLGKSNKKKHKNMDTQTKTQLMQPDEKAGAAYAAPAQTVEKPCHSEPVRTLARNDMVFRTFLLKIEEFSHYLGDCHTSLRAGSQ